MTVKLSIEECREIALCKNFIEIAEKLEELDIEESDLWTAKSEEYEISAMVIISQLFFQFGSIPFQLISW